MKQRVDSLLQQLAAELSQGDFDTAFINRGVALMQALTIETEEDRREHMAGFIRFVEFLLAHAPQSVYEALESNRRVLQDRFDHYYGRPDTPYLATAAIIYRLQQDLQSGGATEALVARAGAELENVPFDDSVEDQAARIGGTLSLQALQAAANWLATGEHDFSSAVPLVALIEPVETAFREGRLNPSLVLSTTAAIQSCPTTTAEDRETRVSVQAVVMGLGLLSRPDAAPAFEPIRERLAELLAEIENQPTDQTESPIDVVLRGYAEKLTREGFTEYALREAMAALQDVPGETADDAKAAHDAMLRLCDLSIPYAPAELAQTLQVTRSMIESQWNGGNEGPLAPEEMAERCQVILQTLKADLESGAAQSPTVMTALAALQALTQRVADDDDATGAVLMKAMMQDLPQILLPYAPAEAEQPFREAMEMMDGTLGVLEASQSADPTAAGVEAQAFTEGLARFSQAADPQTIPEEFRELPHLRQFVELIPSLMQRLSPLGLDQTSKDQSEIKRLAKRFDQTMKVAGYAPTESEYLRHQRGALRRVAVELRQFERRHHLTLLQPPFPTNAVTADPNAVFFSGSPATEAIVAEACATLAMNVASADGVDNRTHRRWQQLRHAGVAVFDYSAYDPQHADPAGLVPRAPEAEVMVLGAASTVATVAYEAGWAIVLGTPMVVTARAGQAVPFDMDIEPVRLHDDGLDGQRLAAAIQASLYGVQRGIAGSSLTATVEEVRRHYAQHADGEVRTLLAALDDVRDATRVRLALRAVLERAGGENALLVLPAFPGRYPAPAARRRLFHVTAFREWTRAAQEETQQACKRHDIEYAIGYDRLNPDVLGSIWIDLCESSFVVADITNLNPNAVLELAIAQALGRKTLIVTQNSAPHGYLPAIEKVRTHRYDPDQPSELAKLLDAFLV
jgi:hypothetical protein